LIFVVPLLVK